MIREKIYQVLESGYPISRLSRSFDLFMMGLIMANVASVVFETVPIISNLYGDYLYAFDIFSVVVFTVEYILRIWVSIENPPVQRHGPIGGRIKFALSPFLIIDLLAFLPFYISLLFPIVDLRVLRIFRLMRMLKLARYSPALTSITRVIIEEKKALFASLFIMFGLLIISSTAMYYAERHIQPDIFGSIPQAMWWGLATLTTVGYGDHVPASEIGRFIGGIVMIFGLGIAALPIAIIASGFSTEIHRRDFVVSFSMVANVPLFSKMDVSTISKITKLLQAFDVPAGSIIIRKDEAPDAMYFITNGKVEVELLPNSIHLTSGEHFGEIGLIKKIPRTANVRAVTACKLLVLEQDAFDKLINSEPEALKTLQAITENRLSKQNN